MQSHEEWLMKSKHCPRALQLCTAQSSLSVAMYHDIKSWNCFRSLQLTVQTPFHVQLPEVVEAQLFLRRPVHTQTADVLARHSEPNTIRSLVASDVTAANAEARPTRDAGMITQSFNTYSLRYCAVQDKPFTISDSLCPTTPTQRSNCRGRTSHSCCDVSDATTQKNKTKIATL